MAREALFNPTKPIVAELCANIVRMDADFSLTPFDSEKSRAGAKMSNVEQQEKLPAYSPRRLRLVSGARDGEAGAVSERLNHGGAEGAKPKPDFVASLLVSLNERRA